ncbi:MAG: hypothetical protein ACR2HX_24105 [Pyrinomonadaceae bacterium]
MKTNRIIILLSSLLTGILFSGCFIIDRTAKNKAEKYPEMLAKKDDLVNLKTSEKLGGEEKLKGKIAVVRKDKEAKVAMLDRFSYDGEFSSSSPGENKEFLPAEIYARKPDEIETLIKIECRKVRDFGNYRQGGSSTTQSVEVFNVVCDVGVIDYKTATVFAKSTFGDRGAPGAIITGTSPNGEFPGKQIRDFLSGFPSTILPRTLAPPSGETLSASDLAVKTKKSMESVAQYNGKEITINGYSYISSRAAAGGAYSIFLGAKDATLIGSPTIRCGVNPPDIPDFRNLTSGDHNLTVVGTFEAQYSSGNLKNCRLVKAD